MNTTTIRIRICRFFFFTSDSECRRGARSPDRGSLTPFCFVVRRSSACNGNGRIANCERERVLRVNPELAICPSPLQVQALGLPPDVKSSARL